MTRRFLLVSAASVLLGASARAQVPGQPAAVQKTADSDASALAQKFNCAGTVVDAEGHPLAGATVEYWHDEGNPFQAAGMKLKKQVTTETNGAFQFQVSPGSGFLLARKPGLAPGWIHFGQPFASGPETEEKLVLAPPAALAGIVADEAGKPVANAEVSVTAAIREISQDAGLRGYNLLLGNAARNCFMARTDAAGHFSIENFPTNATAALAVQAPGKALRESAPDFEGMNSLPWRGGQEDIKFVVEPAGSIEGKIMVEGSNQPPPAARLTLQSDQPGNFRFEEREPAQSGTDGAFEMHDAAAGAYHVHAVFGSNAVPEWVADGVAVTVESGKPTRGVQVTAIRGGLLEAAVLEENNHKPLAQITVTAYKTDFQSAANSDSNGIVHLRLPPGDYQITASRELASSIQTSASVEAGKTNRVEIEIAPPKRITGIVRQPNGHPAAGQKVTLVGGFGPNAADVKTDADGKFELEWDPRRFGRNNGNATTCVLVRDAERNLAAAQDVEEDAGPLDLKLAPGLTLAGRVESDGKPITNATASLVFWTGRSGMYLTGFSRQTNATGGFEIFDIPPGRHYGVSISARGYGKTTINDINATTEAGRMELDPFKLKPANLKLAGQVLDADDKPVASANVSLFGEGQPSGNARTDPDGRFHFDHVCEGSIQLSANGRNSFGNVSAEGGDTNVVLRLGQNVSYAPGSKAHKLNGTVTDAEGKPAAGAQVAVFPEFQFNDSRWSKTATNGAFSLSWSLQPWQTQQGGGALLVARDPVRNLAATAELTEDMTNLDVKLQPALTVAGVVRNADDSPLAGAQVNVQLKTGNMYGQLDQKNATADAQGRYEIKCLPPEGSYLVIASANGHGQSQQPVQGDSETNRVELSPFVLKVADRLLAGQVRDENDKPVSGANVNLNGKDQLSGNMATDNKGQFHFKVCEGQVRLFANSPRGGGFAQASADAGDTNVVLTLNSQPGRVRQAPARRTLKGNPLPQLTGVNLADDATPAGQPVLLCLFDAGQRSSRHAVHQLEEQAGALRQQGVTVLGVQSALTDGVIFNDWKSANPVSFPLGRVTDKTEKSKWASDVPALPWLILTDAHHQVIAEGFALDELDAQIKKLR